MYPLHPITLEHIQGFLLAHQIQYNEQYPSQGSMYVFKTRACTSMETTVHDAFIDAIIMELKSWSRYDSELKDRDNFKKRSIVERISDVEDLVKSADKWIINEVVFKDKPHKSTGQYLVDLFSELLGKEFEIYRLQFETDYMHGRDFPWHMNLGLGMEFDVFILQGNEHRIFLNFGVQIT